MEPKKQEEPKFLTDEEEVAEVDRINEHIKNFNPPGQSKPVAAPSDTQADTEVTKPVAAPSDIQLDTQLTEHEHELGAEEFKEEELVHKDEKFREKYMKKQEA